MRLLLKNIKKRLHWHSKPDIPIAAIPTNSEPSKLSGPNLPVTTPLPVAFHRKCSSLIYDSFLTVLTTGDLQVLVISGTPTQQELIDAWDEIIQEYVSLVKTEKSTTIFNCWLKVIRTQWLLTLLTHALDALKMQYDEDIANAIAGQGFSLIQPMEDRQKYLKQIYFVEQEAKSLIVQLNQYTTEYKALCPTEAETEKTDIAEYEKELAILSKFMGYRIDKKVITVTEFTSILNVYLEDIKAKNASLNK